MATLHETHPNLLMYVEQMNIWAEFGQGKKIDLRHFTEADRRLVKEQLETDRSPENLTCDGELRGAGLQKRVVFLNSVERELGTL